MENKIKLSDLIINLKIINTLREKLLNTVCNGQYDCGNCKFDEPICLQADVIKTNIERLINEEGTK
ncbi:MAG: hypothetical protein LBK69_05420 [Syntrophomonadaceae bacterium]|jgi:hypothetical protein|nr:hypothetical protein [Syntrophomonadaceae bacterium]